MLHWLDSHKSSFHRLSPSYLRALWIYDLPLGNIYAFIHEPVIFKHLHIGVALIWSNFCCSHQRLVALHVTVCLPNDDGHLMAGQHIHMVASHHAFGAWLVYDPLSCVVLLRSNMPRCHAKAKLVGSTFTKHVWKLLLKWWQRLQLYPIREPLLI